MLLISCAPADPSSQSSDSLCSTPQRLAFLPPDLDEASGLAISRRHPGILWLHNDSGEPVIFALDTIGNLKARIRVLHAINKDWEDIAVGPCGNRTCLYIGAIGDNRHVRSDRAIYVVPEPALTDSVTEPALRIPYSFREGAQDAEAFFVLPDERIYLITKGRSRSISLYSFPLPNRPAEPVTLEPVQALSNGLVQLPEMVTAATATTDGKHILLRTYSAIQLYTLQDNVLEPVDNSFFDLTPLGESQGEGADMTDGGTVFLATERGPSDERPTLSRVLCSIPPGHGRK